MKRASPSAFPPSLTCVSACNELGLLLIDRLICTNKRNYLGTLIRAPNLLCLADFAKQNQRCCSQSWFFPVCCRPRPPLARTMHSWVTQPPFWCSGVLPSLGHETRNQSLENQRPSPIASDPRPLGMHTGATEGPLPRPPCEPGTRGLFQLDHSQSLLPRKYISALSPLKCAYRRFARKPFAAAAMGPAV